VLLSWPKFSLFVDARLLLSMDNIYNIVAEFSVGYWCRGPKTCPGRRAIDRGISLATVAAMYVVQSGSFCHVG